MSQNNVPNTVIVLINNWQNFITTIFAFNDNIQEMMNVEREILAIKEDYQTSYGGHRSGYDFNDYIKTSCRSMNDKLISFAEDYFSGAAGRLKIDTEAIRDKFFSSENCFKSIDFMKVWEYLESEYGQGKGEYKAYAQYAVTIAKKLNIQPTKPIKIVAGHYSLDMSMYLDSIDKKFGQNRYSYTCRDNVWHMCAALTKFLEWADRTECITGLNALADTHGRSQANVTARQKFIFADDFYAITMYQKIEWRMGQALGMKLNEFLVEFGALQFEEAAA